MFTVNKDPSVSELRKFGWAMLIGFGVIGAILWVVAVRRHGGGPLAWSGLAIQYVAIGFIALGIALCVVGVGAPTVSRLIYVAWMTVTVPIGIVMSAVLLSVLFVFFLPLFSVIVRMGDPLRKKLGASSYWEDYKPYEHTLERMRRLF